MRYTFYYDDIDPGRGTMFQVIGPEFARRYFKHLVSEMFPERLAHVRVRIDTVDMEGRIESRDLSIRELAKEV